METFKEKIKLGVIDTLRKFTVEGDYNAYSCVFIGDTLSKKLEKEFDYVVYNLTPEVLESSEDVNEYRQTTISPFGGSTHELEKERYLRKRFCELTIKNLESGVFDITTQVFDTSPRVVQSLLDRHNNMLTVKLILAK